MTAHDNRPHQTDLPQTQDETGQELGHGDARVVARVAGSVPQGAARVDRVVAWIGWHLGELVGVSVPAVLAVTVHPLWTVPAVVVATGWVANEIRGARRKASRRGGVGPAGNGREEWRA